LNCQNFQRSLIALDVFLQPAGEARFIDAMPLLDFPCAGKFFIFPDAVGHDDAPSIFFLGTVGSAIWRSR